MGRELIVAQGAFLAAGPDLVDPNFLHTVVLMCSHTDDGAYGLVLNRPSEFRAREVLGSHPVLGASELRMYIGGPVSLDTLQILHRAPDVITGGMQLAEDLWVGGELDEVGALVELDPERAQRDVKLLLGYAGWGPGQLEGELEEGAWLPARGSAARVFQADAQRLWRDVVLDLGPQFRSLAFEPPDPDWN